MASELAKLPNLGENTADWLLQCGVRSLDDIRSLGVIEVCRRVRELNGVSSLMLAYALEGAIRGCHWNAIGDAVKAELKAEHSEMKRFG